MYSSRGIKMDIHNEPDPEDVYGDIAVLNCDTPAARKLNGTAGHSHDIQPCPYCDVTSADISIQL